MANATYYPARSNNPESINCSFSFLGNGAAQVPAATIYGAKGVLATPFSGFGLNRTGVGLFTINLRDGFQGATPVNAAAATGYQAIMVFDGSVLTVSGASALFMIPLFAGTNVLTGSANQVIKFAIQTGAGTLTDPSTSNLVTVELWFLNSASNQSTTA